MSLSAEYQRKQGFLIGIDKYPRYPLKYCVNDAEDLNLALQCIGFNTVLQKNCDLNQFYRHIDTFVETIMSDDLVLFYFAGHGKQSEDENYLLPSDYDYDYRGCERDYVTHNAINIKYILKKINERKNSVTICLLDCCRHITRMRAVNTNRGLLPMTPQSQTLFVFSCAPGKSVQDETRNNRNGSFVENLLKYISIPDKDIEEIMKNVAYDVHKQTDGFQSLYRIASLINRVCLVINDNQGKDIRVLSCIAQQVKKGDQQLTISLKTGHRTISQRKSCFIPSSHLTENAHAR